MTLEKSPAPATTLVLSQKTQGMQSQHDDVFQNLFTCVDSDDNGMIDVKSLEMLCVNYPEIAALLGVSQRRSFDDAFFEIGKDVAEDISYEDFFNLIKVYNADRRIEVTPRTRQRIVYDIICRKVGVVNLPTIADVCMQKPAVARLLVSVGTAASERRAADMLEHLALVHMRGSSSFNSNSAPFAEFCSLINYVRGVSLDCCKKLTERTQANLCEEYLAFALLVANRRPKRVADGASQVQSTTDVVAKSSTFGRRERIVSASQENLFNERPESLPKLFADLKFSSSGLLLNTKGKLSRGSCGEVLKVKELVCCFDNTLMKSAAGRAISRKNLSFRDDGILTCETKIILGPDNKPITRDHVRVQMDGKPLLGPDNKIIVTSTESALENVLETVGTTEFQARQGLCEIVKTNVILGAGNSPNTQDLFETTDLNGAEGGFEIAENKPGITNSLADNIQDEHEIVRGTGHDDHEIVRTAELEVVENEIEITVSLDGMLLDDEGNIVKGEDDLAVKYHEVLVGPSGEILRTSGGQPVLRDGFVFGSDGSLLTKNYEKIVGDSRRPVSFKKDDLMLDLEGDPVFSKKSRLVLKTNTIRMCVERES